jgi:type II secretory pathway pseudopilin PulG
MLRMFLSTYFRRIISFFQEYAYQRSKKEGFLLGELLIVIAGTTILMCALMQWVLVLQQTAIKNHSMSNRINQLHNALETGIIKKGDRFERMPIAEAWDVTYKGITLTAQKFKPRVVRDLSSGIFSVSGSLEIEELS